MKMLAVKVCLLLAVAVIAHCADTQDHSMDPDFYQCPFGIFGRKPVLDTDGGVLYCDADGVRCPNYYFCSAGYEDGRAVCCHILGP